MYFITNKTQMIAENEKMKIVRFNVKNTPALKENSVHYFGTFNL